MKLVPTMALAALIPIAAAVPAFAAVPAIPSLPEGSAQLSASAPWWEKLVVTVGDEGETRACQYETSIDPGKREPCEVEGTAGPAASVPEQFTRITFERRYSPAANLADGEVAAGDSLIGKSVMALAIGNDGRVMGCKVVATGGTKPDYGCEEARAEKFEASVGAAAVATRVATLTILVYAHEEVHV